MRNYTKGMSTPEYLGKTTVYTFYYVQACY